MTQNRRQFLAAAAACIALPARAGGITIIGGRAFGSYWRLTLPEGARADSIGAGIAAIVAEVDARMSPYRADAELARFNALRTTDWVPVSAATAQVTRAALGVSALTGGAFDPTVGPLVARYGFGPIHSGGFGHFSELAAGASAVRKARADLTLDLCGIAKGHALDRIVAQLDASGIAGFVAELGGEVFTRGSHPEGRPWRIAIDGTGSVLALNDTAVATSGDAEQGYRLGGHRYGHIVDPLRGTSASGGLASVSVIHASALQADALATALFAMGREGAEDFARRNRIDAVLVARDGAGLRTIATDGARTRLLGETSP